MSRWRKRRSFCISTASPPTPTRRRFRSPCWGRSIAGHAAPGSSRLKFRRRITMTFQKTSVAIAVSLALGCVGNAHADQASDMQAKLDALQKEIQELQAQIGALRKKQEQAAPVAAAAPAKAPANEVKPGKELVFKAGGGEVQLYGHADVSLVDQTNGMTGFIHNGLPVTGHNGWVPDVSSNLSFFGVRGNRAVSDDLKGVFQFETEIAYAATPGASDQAAETMAQKFE